MSRRAVVVMVDADQARWLGQCATYVAEQGYELAAIADAATALSMVADGRADVVVAGTGSHLPAVEFAGGPQRPRPVPRESAEPVPAGGGSRRRPQLVSRP
ncbi:hypothetical protein ABZ814_12650 [Micromonospora musae]|uniref:hypothetical protein n=1 Tax=Micromonospora musae TaxID=1894970 RepID=UPI0033F5630C